MDPAEDQGERDGDGEHAAPEEALMHPPAQARAVGDEALGKEVGDRESGDVDDASQNAASAVELPTALPVHAGGRLLDPDVVVVDDAEGREDDGEGVDDERRVEVLEVAGADDDGGDE